MKKIFPLVLLVLAGCSTTPGQDAPRLGLPEGDPLEHIVVLHETTGERHVAFLLKSGKIFLPPGSELTREGVRRAIIRHSDP